MLRICREFKTRGKKTVLRQKIPKSKIPAIPAQSVNPESKGFESHKETTLATENGRRRKKIQPNFVCDSERLQLDS